MSRWSQLLAGAVAATLILATPAAAAEVQESMRIPMSDGVTLQGTLTGAAPLASRPTIVEFSPYGNGSGTTYDGADFNYLLVQIRGTGSSDGEFDALGPRTQEDVVESLAWACRQPWSDGDLGLNGFSASAITVYNSLHLKLPCVRTAVLKSGTFELYRDLLWPGGVSNAVAGLGVLGLIGAPAAAQGLGRSPLSDLDTAIGLFNAGLQGGLAHDTLDQWWQQRGFRGEVNHLPILMVDSFFDVESRGAFQAYQQLRDDGAHLLVVSGHDGSPAGTDGASSATRAWFEHYLRGVANGAQRPPRVKLLLADGSREGYLGGHFVRYDAPDWPVPGTRWESLWLSAQPSGSGHSINDGSLVGSDPVRSSSQAYAAIPTEPSMSDQPNTAIVGPDGINQAAQHFPLLTETTLAEPQALSYTTAPLGRDELAAGPAALDLRLASTAPETAMWAVIADVWPDGTSHPVATGRLLSAFPNVVASKSLRDAQGEIVQPYGDYSVKDDAAPGVARTYQIEFWPIGNRFRRGHRIRLVVLGASGASRPSLPALNTVTLGGAQGSRLLLPLLPAAPEPAGGSEHRGARTACARWARRRIRLLPRRRIRVGPVALGMARARVARLRCLASLRIRVGFATRRWLSRRELHRYRGRAVIVLSASRRFSLAGVRPGVRARAVRRRLRPQYSLRLDGARWYLLAGAHSRGVLEVRRGHVIAVGLAVRRLTATRAQARRLLLRALVSRAGGSAVAW